MSAIAQHSSKTSEHFTPLDIVDRARRLLGGFDLDPASCAAANERVLAQRFLGVDQDGLSRRWAGRVFLNPPGGKLKKVGKRWVTLRDGPGESSMRVWWEKLSLEYDAGRVTSAFFVGFTLEILRTSQSCAIPVQAFPRCYPAARLAFGGDQPTHANVLVYLPPRDSTRGDAVVRLRDHFGEVGLCEESGCW